MKISEKLEHKFDMMWSKSGNVNIRRGIFQGDSLSQLLFVICMYDTSESDIKKTTIRIYLEKSKKVEPPIVYG